MHTSLGTVLNRRTTSAQWLLALMTLLSLLSAPGYSASLNELKATEQELEKKLQEVRSEIAHLEGKPLVKSLNLNLLLTSMNKNAAHYQTRTSLSEMHELTDLLREKIKPVVDGKSLALDLRVRQVKFKRRSGIAKISVSPGTTLPFLGIKSSDRNLSVGLVHTLEIKTTEEEALGLQTGAPLTLSGTALFVGTRDDYQELPKAHLEAVEIRMFGAPATSGFGKIYLLDSEITVEKTGATYHPE